MFVIRTIVYHNRLSRDFIWYT